MRKEEINLKEEMRNQTDQKRNVSGMLRARRDFHRN